MSGEKKIYNKILDNLENLDFLKYITIKLQHIQKTMNPSLNSTFTCPLSKHFDKIKNSDFRTNSSLKNLNYKLRLSVYI